MLPLHDLLLLADTFFVHIGDELQDKTLTESMFHTPFNIFVPDLFPPFIL